MKYVIVSFLALILIYGCSEKTTLSAENESLLVEFQEAKDQIDLDDQENSIKRLKEVLAKSKKQGFHYLTARTYTYIGWIFDQNMLYKKAYVAYSDAIRYWDKSDSVNQKNLFACYNNIGLISSEYKDHEQAIEYFTKATELESAVSLFKASDLNYNLGATYFAKGDAESIQLAEESMQRALKIAEEAEYANGVASVYYYIGLMYSNLGDYEIAEMSYKNAIKYAKDNDLDEFLECSYHGLGLVYSKRSEDDDAIKYLNQAAQYQYDDQVHYSANIDLGNSYLKVGQYDQAVEILENVIAKYDNIEERNLSDLYNQLAIGHQKLGNTDQALAYISENNRTLQGMIASADYIKGDYEKILFKDVVSQYEEFQNKESLRNLIFYTYLPAGAAFLSLLMLTLLFFAYQRKTKRKLTAAKIKSFQVD